MKEIKIQISDEKHAFLQAQAEKQCLTLESLIFLAISHSHWTHEPSKKQGKEA